jgi:hypothetical protein
VAEAAVAQPQRPANSPEAQLGTLPKIALSQPEDTEARSSEPPADEDVPPEISRNFRPPIRSIRLRNVPAFRAPVPKAAIDENRDASLSNEQVGLAQHPRWVEAPPPKLVPSQQ